MAIDPDIQPHLDALTDRIVRVEARATQAEQDLAIIEPSIAQLEQTVAALEQTPGTPGGIKNPAIIVAAANSPQAIKARADIVCDRTNITDARQHDAEQAAGVIEQAMRNEGLIDKDVRLMGEIITEALDAAGFDVVLRADPDTEPDGETPEAFSVVLDELIAVEPDDGFSREDVARAIVGMLQVAGLLTAEVLTDHNTSDGLFTEARRLLDAATPGPWTHPSPTTNWFTTPQPIQIDEADWGQETQEGGAMCGYRIGTLADERAWRYADVELIAAAPRLIAALLERAVTAEADLRALSTRTTGDSKVDLRMLYAYEAGIMERDAERAARERAEAEARQLREAIRAHENLHRPDGPDGADGPIEMDGWPCCNDDRLLWAAAVAEVAEDRGQTDG
jgi:hypothetical protein